MSEYAEWAMSTSRERLVCLDDMIFAAVMEGIDASVLSARRDELWLMRECCTDEA